MKKQTVVAGVALTVLFGLSGCDTMSGWGEQPHPHYMPPADNGLYENAGVDSVKADAPKRGGGQVSSQRKPAVKTSSETIEAPAVPLDAPTIAP